MTGGGTCRGCGGEHDPERVRINAHVIVVGSHFFFRGCIGVVVSWTTYGTPLRIRVAFAPGVLYTNERSITRENFYPCELLYVRARIGELEQVR